MLEGDGRLDAGDLTLYCLAEAPFCFESSANLTRRWRGFDIRKSSRDGTSGGNNQGTGGGSSQGIGGGGGSSQRSVTCHGDQPSKRNIQISNSGGIAAEGNNEIPNCVETRGRQKRLRTEPRNDEIPNSGGIVARRNSSAGTDSLHNGDLGTNSGGGTDSVRTKRAAAVETRGRRKRSRTEIEILYEDGKWSLYLRAIHVQGLYLW